MRTAEIRRRFLDFFAERGHVAVQQARGDLDAESVGQCRQVARHLLVQSADGTAVEPVGVPAGRAGHPEGRSVVGPLQSLQVGHDPVQDDARQSR
ncbi:hypothetical protein PEM37_09270 [Streptomyces sp. AD681]|uniref:hypothetical protein n=1 Tax=Streptomyces sp. AD681 TaxID=3019069 RepID=UPI0022F1A98C|nr:hypothetical protein [Streptomyces sp. AD681]MDA5141697.1 hypothetical protein [Streptomyces sp. AD681]